MERNLTTGACRLLPVSLVLMCAACQTETPPRFTADPIVTVAHGGVYESDGGAIVPNRQYIIDAQEYYISTVWNERKTETPEFGSSIHETVYDLVDDRVLANALFLDWLLDGYESSSATHIQQVTTVRLEVE